MRHWTLVLAMSFLVSALAGCTAPGPAEPAKPQEDPVAPTLSVTLRVLSEEDRRIEALAHFSDGVVPDEASWDWGDATSRIDNPAVHVYRDDGAYTVQVQAIHPDQGMTSASQDVALGDTPADPPDEGGSQDPEPSPEPSSNGTTNGTQEGSAPGNETSDGRNGTQESGNSSRPFEPEDPQKSCGSFGSLEPVLPLYMDPVGAATGWPLLRLDVVMIADPLFVEAHPGDWQELLVDLVADASVHYEQQMGLRLEPLLVTALPPGSLEPGTGDGQQRAVARGFMHANHPDLDFDYVAVILGGDYEGSVAGQVECVHGAVNKENAYLWSEYDEPRAPNSGVAFFEDTPLKVFMHETAHLLAAHHHYTQCGTTMTGYGPHDALAVCGTMINDIGLASYTFSQTNRILMRSFVEEIGIGEPVEE